LAHTPFVPPPFLAAVHARHVPVHASLQQTPSTQKPLAHTLLPVHAAPMASKHLPELQT
jgi:hypothetical protein